MTGDDCVAPNTNRCPWCTYFFRLISGCHRVPGPFVSLAADMQSAGNYPFWRLWLTAASCNGRSVPDPAGLSFLPSPLSELSTFQQPPRSHTSPSINDRSFQIVQSQHSVAYHQPAEHRSSREMMAVSSFQHFYFPFLDHHILCP